MTTKKISLLGSAAVSSPVEGTSLLSKDVHGKGDSSYYTFTWRGKPIAPFATRVLVSSKGGSRTRGFRLMEKDENGIEREIITERRRMVDLEAELEKLLFASEETAKVANLPVKGTLKKS